MSVENEVEAAGEVEAPQSVVPPEAPDTERPAPIDGPATPPVFERPAHTKTVTVPVHRLMAPPTCTFHRTPQGEFVVLMSGPVTPSGEGMTFFHGPAVELLSPAALSLLETLETEFAQAAGFQKV